jgi:hypothetical protein
MREVQDACALTGDKLALQLCVLSGEEKSQSPPTSSGRIPRLMAADVRVVIMEFVWPLDVQVTLRVLPFAEYESAVPLDGRVRVKVFVPSTMVPWVVPPRGEVTTRSHVPLKSIPGVSCVPTTA